MKTKQDHPPSRQRRALTAAALSTALGVAAITGGIPSSTAASSTANVTTMGAVPAAPVTFASTTTTTATTAPATTTTAVTAPVPAPAATTAVAPAIPKEDASAAALRYIAATRPQPEPQPAPAADPAPRSGGSVEDAIATYFGDVYDKAVRVARCESSMNPNAVSAGGGNHGLFQINTVHQGRVEAMGYSWDQILDPYVNSAVARSIYDDAGGWGPWGCRGA